MQQGDPDQPAKGHAGTFPGRLGTVTAAGEGQAPGSLWRTVGNITGETCFRGLKKSYLGSGPREVKPGPHGLTFPLFIARVQVLSGACLHHNKTREAESRCRAPGDSEPLGPRAPGTLSPWGPQAPGDPEPEAAFTRPAPSC